MKSFQYLTPDTISEACYLKKKYGARACFLAGGTDVVVNLRNKMADFEYLIDISRLSIDYIHEKSEGVTLGSMVTVNALANSDLVKKRLPVLSSAAPNLGTPQTRNIATIGGNICNAAPSADLVPSLLVLDAQLILLSIQGKRTIDLKDFFKGVNQTFIREDELLLEINIPITQRKAVYYKIGRTAIDITVSSVAVALEVNKDGECTLARIALGAAAPIPMRAMQTEKWLCGKKLETSVINEAGQKVVGEAKPRDSIRASAAYRREVTKSLVKRALTVLKGGRGNEIYCK